MDDELTIGVSLLRVTKVALEARVLYLKTMEDQGESKWQLDALGVLLEASTKVSDLLSAQGIDPDKKPSLSVGYAEGQFVRSEYVTSQVFKEASIYSILFQVAGSLISERAMCRMNQIDPGSFAASISDYIRIMEEATIEHVISLSKEGIVASAHNVFSSEFLKKGFA